MLDGCFDDLCRDAGLGEIGGDHLRLAARGAHRSGHFLQRCLAAADQGEASAMISEAERETGADTASCAGQQYRALVKVHRVLLP